MKLVVSLRVGLVALVAAVAVPLSAQVASRPSLTLDGARAVIAAALAEARAVKAPGGVVAVVDAGGNLMALERLDETFAAGANISIGKARTAALFKRPTRAFEEIIRNGRTAMTALPDFTPLQGGVPLVVDGVVVGGVGVSGAASAEQDEVLALAGAAVLAVPSTPTQTGMAQYFDAAGVAASFDRGAVLLDGSGGRPYMIHTSRRDKAGEAEIHARETDVIYIVRGSATLVTGGRVTGARTTGPDEVRGTSIDGGETRRLSPGDVIVVPNGVPHWFQSVEGVLHYYVVKVRSERAASMPVVTAEGGRR
jgi:glc operon protein GlcG